MEISITAERPDTPDAIRLISELDAVLTPLYPPSSRHGFPVDQLLAEQVAFFVLRADRQPAACGGILLVGTAYGELKRMYVRPQFRGLGFGRLIVQDLASYAQSQGITLLRLETGIHQHAAIRMYEGLGFYRIPPFGPYRDDPLSVYFEKQMYTGQ